MEHTSNTSSHRSTLRVLEILENISSSSDGYTLTELSALLNAPKSSLLPIIQTLHKKKYLLRNLYTNQYRLGLMAFKVGQRYLDQLNIMDIVKEEMILLTKKCCETCFFGILADGYTHYLVKIDSPEPIRMFGSAGKQLPAYSTGLGKALLSGYTYQELVNMYPNGLTPVTEHTISDMETLDQQLQQTRLHGFAYETEESTMQIRCVAVPIKNGSEVIAGLSVAIPIFRYNDEKVEQAKKALLHAKSVIEKAVINFHLDKSAFI